MWFFIFVITVFQSTLPQGEWLKSCVFLSSHSTFQSTLPQGEWPTTQVKLSLYFKFQSTLPQGEWRNLSITIFPYSSFQSTLPQGEWLYFIEIRHHFFYFNPHSHKGSDAFVVVKIIFSQISIHTPTRGVTLLLFSQSLNSTDFNPHSHKGSDDYNIFVSLRHII